MAYIGIGLGLGSYHRMYSSVHAWPAPVCAQRGSKVDIQKTQVRPCNTIAPGAALAQRSGAH